MKKQVKGITKAPANAKDTATKSIVVLRKEATTLSNTVGELVVESPEDVAAATTVLQNIATSKKLITAEQKKVVDKLNDLIDIEKARWKPSLDLLTAADTKLRKQVMDYRAESQRKAAEAEARVLKQVSTGRIKNETTAMRKIDEARNLSVGKSVSTGSATASFKGVQKLKIVNEALIPLEYMLPNEKAIRAAFKAGNPVPGCEMVTEETLAIR